jgi:hypothetical protein
MERLIGGRDDFVLQRRVVHVPMYEDREEGASIRLRPQTESRCSIGCEFRYRYKDRTFPPSYLSGRGSCCSRMDTST